MFADNAYIVAVGGDGTTLHALQAARSLKETAVFAMRLPDSVGALGNPLEISNLAMRLETAQRLTIRPLRAEATPLVGNTVTCFGINEIVISREQLQAAKLLVTIGQTQRPRPLVGDGLLVATPIGSSGYNQAAGGSTLPRTSRLLALTGIAVRQPSDWRNTVFDDQTVTDVEVVDPQYRSVRIETNVEEHRQISRVRISCDHETPLTLLLENH